MVALFALVGVLLAVLPCPASSFLTSGPGILSVRPTGSMSRQTLARSDFTPTSTLLQHRASLRERRVASTVMALEGGVRVAVLGGFERIGVCTLQGLTASPFKPVMQTPQGFTTDMRVRWPIDGLGNTMPKNVQYTDELPVCPGVIMASEEPVAGPDIEFVLNNMQGLKKVVFMSRAGVDQRDNFFKKFNPFLKLAKWAEAEEAVKQFAAANNIEATIVRVGALEGGPFYNSNAEFQSALEGNLFDLEAKALELSVEDKIDGKTSRDLASLALIQALSRDLEVFSVISKKQGPLTCSVPNHMKLPDVGPKKRQVFTPTPEEWDAAFAQA